MTRKTITCEEVFLGCVYLVCSNQHHWGRFGKKWGGVGLMIYTGNQFNYFPIKMFSSSKQLNTCICKCFNYGLWTIFWQNKWSKFDVGFYLCEQLLKNILRATLINMEQKNEHNIKQNNIWRIFWKYFYTRYIFYHIVKIFCIRLLKTRFMMLLR